MDYSGAGGKLIHEKNQKQKISWHCPFKRTGSQNWPGVDEWPGPPGEECQRLIGPGVNVRHVPSLWEEQDLRTLISSLSVKRSNIMLS